jgi:hypothetical protein
MSHRRDRRQTFSQTNHAATRLNMETSITDEFMQQMLATAKNYYVVILRGGPNRSRPDAEQIVWEHGRRNFRLRAEGIVSIVCPVIDGGDIKGVILFNASREETKRIMDGDPGVQTGVFVYDAHPCRGFPGDSLAK